MGEKRGERGRFAPKYAPDESRPCPRCERFLDADRFFAKQKNDDGSIRTRQTLCKDCMRERQRELGGHKERSKMSKAERKRRRQERYVEMMADPERAERHRAERAEQARRRRERAKADEELAERLRQITRRYYEKVRNDPEAWRLRLMDQRIRYRGENDPRFLHTVANGAWYGGAHLEEMVPADPFLDFLSDTFPAASAEDLQAMTGIPSRRFREFREGKAVVSLDLVDRALTKGLGRPDLLAVLYPYDGGNA